MASQQLQLLLPPLTGQATASVAAEAAGYLGAITVGAKSSTDWDAGMLI